MNRTKSLLWVKQCLALFVVLPACQLVALSSASAQGSPGSGRIWIGPPANPERYYYATDNGIPGTGRYAYFDYNWPSLRQALNEYGWFGRRYRRNAPSAAPASVIMPSERPTLDPRAPREEPALPAPRKLGD